MADKSADAESVVVSTESTTKSRIIQLNNTKKDSVTASTIDASSTSSSSTATATNSSATSTTTSSTIANRTTKPSDSSTWRSSPGGGGGRGGRFGGRYYDNRGDRGGGTGRGNNNNNFHSNNQYGGGYFNRQRSQPRQFDADRGPYHHQRPQSHFNHPRHRSYSRSRSRSPARSRSPRSRSRSRSPRSMRSFSRSRSRSRSRSWSPRGNRSFSGREGGWDRGGPYPYTPSSGGRERYGNDYYRGHSREREPSDHGGGRGGWSGGRGSGRYPSYPRGSGRFHPKDQQRYPFGKGGNNRRSPSRERANAEGNPPVSGSFRDRRERQLRERERRSASASSEQLKRSGSFTKPLEEKTSRDEEKAKEELRTKRGLLLSARTLPPRPSPHMSTSSNNSGSRASTPKESVSAQTDEEAKKNGQPKETNVVKSVKETGEVDDKDVATSAHKDKVDDAKEQLLLSSGEDKDLAMDESVVPVMRSPVTVTEVHSPAPETTANAIEKTMEAGESQIDSISDDKDFAVTTELTSQQPESPHAGDSVKSPPSLVNTKVKVDTAKNKELDHQMSSPMQEETVMIGDGIQIEQLQVHMKSNSDQNTQPVSGKSDENSQPSTDAIIIDAEVKSPEKRVHGTESTIITSSSSEITAQEEIKQQPILDTTKAMDGTATSDGEATSATSVLDDKEELGDQRMTNVENLQALSDISPASPITESRTSEKVYQETGKQESPIISGAVAKDVCIPVTAPVSTTTSSDETSRVARERTADTQRNDVGRGHITETRKPEDRSARSKNDPIARDQRGAPESMRRLSMTDDRNLRRTGSFSQGTDRDDVKPRAASFSSSPSTAISRERRDSGYQDATSNASLRPMTSLHHDRRDMDPKHRGVSSDHKVQSPQRGSRLGLERHASFTSDRTERAHPMLSKSKSFTVARSTTSTSTHSITPSAHSPLKQLSGDNSNGDGRKRLRRDEERKDEATQKEIRASGSGGGDRSVLDHLKSNKGPVDRNSPRRESRPHQSTRPAEAASDLREELPALPDIPLPTSNILLPSSSADIDGDAGVSTPTKISKRPRLGWGQGLVALSPSQPQKRPRIGWGEGLVPELSSNPSPSKGDNISEESSSHSVVSADQVNGQSVVSIKTEVLVVKKDGDKNAVESTTSSIQDGELRVSENDKDGDQKMEVGDSSFGPQRNEEARNAVTVEVSSSTEPDTDADIVSRPSKEAILSSIDELDSDISEVKKQIKMLQKLVVEVEESAKVSQESSEEDASASVHLDGQTAATTGVVDSDAVNPISNIWEQAEANKPKRVRVAVDRAMIELVGNLFFDNMRKAAAANKDVPVRMVNGIVETKIYHQPSDYPFYQRNIDRGNELAECVRLKVRQRNRLRYEHLKKSAREYVDLKKAWKVRVKKMEKDRKRQDKLRNKQKLKQKQKGTAAGGDASTGQSSTGNSHSHPQLCVPGASNNAALGTTDANPLASSTSSSVNAVVRTSSRLTNNSSADLHTRNELEKLEQAKAQALIDQEIRKKRLKNAISTVLPDMIISPAERRSRIFVRYTNGQGCMSDGLVMDLKQREKAEMLVNPWGDLEKCIYIDKFLQYPKNFPRIASFLSNKTTGDVITFYYRTKKIVDYKALLREQQLRRRGTGSKNTWSCWNLSACAAICLGVKFPEKVARLLLHPSNFRSHQASDNIINSAGAQLLLRNNSKEGTGTMESGVTGVSALTMLAASECVPPSAAQVDNESANEGTADAEKFSLFSQQLTEFVAGQQRPFLVNFTDFLSDNSYSTGYEVSALSVEERLKRYHIPVDTTGESRGQTSSNRVGESSHDGKVKHQTSGGGTSKNGSTGSSVQLTKKEIKQQRKLKKAQDGSANGPASSASTSSAAGATLILTGSAAGSSGVATSGGRKKNPLPSPGVSTGSGNRNSPRVVTPGDEKPLPTGKKSTKSGNATPSSRKQNAGQGAGVSSPKVQTTANSVATAASSVLSTAAGGIQVSTVDGMATSININVVSGGIAASQTTPTAAMTSSGNNSTAASSKRVVQKWTEAEKADFLKFFSMHGKDWATLTDSIPTKTAAQIKNYYQNYKNRLGLQEILKRRIENASSGNNGQPSSAAAAGIAAVLNAASPRDNPSIVASSSTGSGPSTISASMAESVTSHPGISSIAQGLHNVGSMPEMPTPSLAMLQPHGQRDSSREIQGATSNSERYLKLLNMQHQLQMMQLQHHQHQQQQKSHAMATEGNAGNVSPYHEAQMKSAANSRMLQFSQQHPQQQQHPVLQQHLSLHSLQQAAAAAAAAAGHGGHGHMQSHPHSHMMQLPIPQQRGSYAEVPHPSLYHPIAHVGGHPHPVAATHMNLSTPSTRSYPGMESSGSESNLNTGMLPASSNPMAHHDMSSRAMMSLAMMNNAASGAAPQRSLSMSSAQSNPNTSPHQLVRSHSGESTRSDSGMHQQNAYRGQSSNTATTIGNLATSGRDDALKAEPINVSMKEEQLSKNITEDTGRTPLSSPTPVVQPTQTVRIPTSSRMSFSSILNESESPRTSVTPRGASDAVSDLQQQQQNSRRIMHTTQPHSEQQRPSMASSTGSNESIHSPRTLPSPTAHLLSIRSTSTSNNRMGLMSSLLNVSSPDNRSSGHHSPMLHRQQVHSDIRSHQPSVPVSQSGRGSSSSGQPLPSSSPVSLPPQMSPSLSSNASGSMSVAGLVRSSSTAVAPASSPHADQRQEMMWSYHQQQMRFEEAELLRRAAMEKELLARRAEEEAERAAAAAAAAARAAAAAQQARQEALDMAANVARYTNAMHQQHQQLQQQHHHHQQVQYQQHQHLQAQHQYQQQQQQQQQHSEYQHHQQFQQQQQQQLHQQQLQHQALHHHLQMMQQQHQQQQQQRPTSSPSANERDTTQQQYQPPPSSSPSH